LCQLHGVHEGASVERVEAGALAALVSRVPRRLFDAEPLREHLNDLAWLERVARSHEAVLDAVLGVATIVPLRLCTIYESPERVGAMLTDDRAALTDTLAFLTGRQEWGAKLIVDLERLTERALISGHTAAERDSAARSEGGAYLARRRLERHLRERTAVLATQAADDTHARLQRCAVDAVARPPQNRDLSGHDGDMVLNAAYLMENDAVQPLREEAAAIERDLADLGARVELTGPWPPYNFLPRNAAAAQL